MLMEDFVQIELLLLLVILLITSLLAFLLGWIARGAKEKTSTTRKNKHNKSNVIFNSTLARAELGKNVKENDLKIIEGIGPKIEELLNQKGITSWFLLSETSKEDLKALLSEAGERFSLHSPDTWPTQAKFAANNQWNELKKFQDS